MQDNQNSDIKEASLTYKLRDMIGESWTDAIEHLFRDPRRQDLMKALVIERSRFVVNPPPERVFQAFRRTPYNKVRVVIMGQEPYVLPNVADGLAFSTYKDSEIPGPLEGIFTELEEDLGIKRSNPNLNDWADQGILLLNAALTSRGNTPKAHLAIWGWFTRGVVEALNRHSDPIIFVGWGKKAQRIIESRVRTDFHHYIKSSHPNFLSARKGFEGSRPFSKINAILRESNQPEIKWN